jgi:ribosomal protein L11 methyltransferase
MTQGYSALTVDLPQGEAELLELLLFELGAQGLEVRDHEAPTFPGVRPPSPGQAIIVAAFPDPRAAQAAAQEVSSRFPAAQVQLEDMPARDWSIAWRDQIRAVEVGRLWVGPPWKRAEAKPSLVPLVIEPKMAFGTGDHPTTRLCLAAIDDFLREHPGASVLDVGTGTGVLALAARKLGAGHTVGVDNDTTSVGLAKENALLNAVEGVTLTLDALEDVAGRFDLVVANILANTLVELAPALAAHASGRLVLAGVLLPQRAEVAHALEACGLRDVGGAAEGDWVRLDFERKT